MSAAAQLDLDLRKRPAGTTATGTQLFLFRLTAECGEFGRCLCGRLSTDGGWGPPYFEEFTEDDGTVVLIGLDELWHCRRCGALAVAEYSRRLDLVQDLERRLGLGRARPYRPHRTALPAPSMAHPAPNQRSRG